MTETSLFWNGTAVGDASLAPYDAPDEFAQAVRAWSGVEATPDKSGVVYGALNILLASAVANTVTLQTGLAIVHGTVYKSDADIVFTIPIPSASTRIDRIALRKSWAGQTVRAVHLQNGAEGTGTPPALTQVDGTTWEARLWQVSITTAGVITLTPEAQLIDIVGFVPLRDVRVRKTADETLANSTIFQDDDELTFSAGASEVYTINIGLRVIGPDAANFKVSLTVPSGATFTLLGFGNSDPETNLNAKAQTAPGPGVFEVLTFGTGALVETAIFITGTVLTGIGGPITVKWAKSVADAGITTVFQGSYLEARQIS